MVKENFKLKGYINKHYCNGFIECKLVLADNIVRGYGTTQAKAIDDAFRQVETAERKECGHIFRTYEGSRKRKCLKCDYQLNN